MHSHCICMYRKGTNFRQAQFCGTSEHYGKAQGRFIIWMNELFYTACCWFSTSSNIFNASITVLTNQGVEVTDCTVQSVEYWCFYGTCRRTSPFKPLGFLMSLLFLKFIFAHVQIVSIIVQLFSRINKF